jgi:hypothetical protein
MTLKKFIKQYDKEGSIVLLEGKRNVKDTDKEKLTALANLITINTKKILFRSGNADGADHYFSLGVTSVDSSRLQVITPYTGHRKKTNQAYETIPLDEINLAEEPEIVYQAKQNKKTEKLIDQYVSGDRDRFALKAAYILRDTIKAIGSKEIASATFGIFYDDLDDPKTGGTGHTMKICEQNGIDVIDQRTWFRWL